MSLIYAAKQSPGLYGHIIFTRIQPIKEYLRKRADEGVLRGWKRLGDFRKHSPQENKLDTL